MAAILKLCVPFLSVMTHNTGGMPPLLCLPMWASVHLPILRKVKFAYTYLAALTSLLEAGTLTDRLLSEKALWKRTDFKKCFTAWITTLSDFLGPNVPNNSLCYFVSFHVSPHRCWGLWAQMVLHLHCSPLPGWYIFIYFCLHQFVAFLETCETVLPYILMAFLPLSVFCSCCRGWFSTVQSGGTCITMRCLQVLGDNYCISALLYILMGYYITLS